MTDNQKFTEIRSLLGLATNQRAPVTVSALHSVDHDFYQAEDIWPAYQALPYGSNAGLAGLYATWLAKALADNLLVPEDLQSYKEQLLNRILTYVVSDESLQLTVLHGNRRALDQCFFHLQTWYNGLGASGRKFVERVELLCGAMQSDTSVWAQALEDFNKLGDRELDKAAMLAERMQVSELGRIRAATAQQKVTDIYNHVVARRMLPESALVFIEEVILPSLQFALINGDDHDSERNFWERSLRLLVWALNPEKSEEDRQAFFQKGPALLSQLETAKANQVCTPDVYQSHLDDLSTQVITLLKGQTIDTVEAAKKQESEDAESLKQLQTGAAQHQFASGDWIEFNDGQQRLRCQFLMQAPGTDKLLFVNRNGHKVLQKSVAEIAACFDAGIAHEIPHLPVLSAALTAVNARMGQLQQQLEARAQVKQLERQRLERKALEIKQAKAKVQAERKVAEAKARAEAERLAQEKIERERQEREQQEAEQREAKEQAMRDLIDQLTLGTWADLPTEAGKTVRCKLAVSLRSTGKYIFVDRVGTKVAELKYDELLEFLLQGKAVFYQPEQGFENRLENIVRGLRRTE
ncbi:DUF1631 domain-containing protein [Gilvimarinus agarilyticus]|uniref:DUF1631 family protein n=1 Tax=unclassified Gilvimarinus TaxID=2642066 RepID=UPI001C0A5008|nr:MULTISPECIES: DUF1631 family protein [unclassified Gilvimarinus]MBU2884396.1 DUF1631 domain-containing protein [Gilvimarinus agarilyticus]MDO6569532.1 DUF1631 family protein [Gilvimarinus sp. 2_MG-2023]MDO6748142.1 DUF1631 family protein [Gilvimarinus sp. 1_MG-2023]